MLSAFKMNGALGLESFIAALACLCSSTFGPACSNSSIVGSESGKHGAISTMDLSIIQILVNSKSKFSIKNTNSDCEMPDSENISKRLHSIEEGIKKQNRISKKLEKDLERLSGNAKLHCDCEQKDAEIRALRNKIATLEAQKPSRSKNICLHSNKHGFTEITALWPFKIFCDQKLDKKYGRGWMLMAQRFDGKGHFFQKWDSYAKGFGVFNVSSEFFMGLEVLSILTNKYPYELLFVLTDGDNVERYAHYDLFAIGSEREKFVLKSLGTYSGDAGDSLRYHLGQKFSTWDSDNDASAENCAVKHSGAWWYKNCHKSNLFGIYKPRMSDNIKNRRNGMIWSTFHDTNGEYLVSMRMYIKPKEE